MVQQYGTEHFGKLRKVLLHHPEQALKRITQENKKTFLFDELPDIANYLREQEKYAKLLESCGVEVLWLDAYVKKNTELIERLPNLAYLHDIAVITSRGAILSKMVFPGRRNEEVVVKEALVALGIPLFHEFGPGDMFEGCLLLSPETLFIANTERHCAETIEQFLPKALELFSEVIWVDIPKARRYMHPDMVFNRINPQLAVAYLPAFIKTRLVTSKGITPINDFADFMDKRGVEVIPLSSEEQRLWGCTFVPIEPNVVVHYNFAWREETKQILRQRGVNIIEFQPDALLAGGGSLRCLTLRLWREKVN